MMKNIQFVGPCQRTDCVENKGDGDVFGALGTLPKET